jgi:Protein of unknown function (DUF3455)
MKSTHNTIRAYGKGALVTIAMVAGTSLMMAACSTVKAPPKEYSQELLPDAVKVPAGNVVALETTAVGVLNYECRANSPTAGMIGWALVSPKADLLDRTGKTVVAYSGPPPTWTNIDGSSVVGSQVAIAPVVGANNLPLQLSKGTPGAAPGGTDFVNPCTQGDIGKKVTLPYQADYIFWKAA